MYEIKDIVALVTGAANGIGAEVVRILLQEGAKHVAILDVDESTGVAFQNELNAKYGDNKAKFYKCDVTNDSQLFGALKSVTNEQGYIDLVINNAGIMNDAPGVYKKEIEINVTALITSTLKSLELMRKDEGGKGGTVINISSIAGLSQSSVLPIYFATKAAVLQFSSCIGKEDFYSKTGVRVLTVCFGVVNTALISTEKVGSLDHETDAKTISGLLKTRLYVQKIESAAKGLVDAYKLGKSGSTWLATRDLPVREITTNITEAYKIMGEHN